MKKNLSFLINPVHMPNKVCSRFISIVMIFFLLLMVSNANLIGQTKNITVSGIVKDSYGEPIAGVNIVVEGTAIGTISDPFGNYSLQVADNVNLVYSFIGFKQIVIPVKGKTKINVTLEEDISDLNEVVVVGYGTQKAGNLTGAIETIKMDKIDNAPVSNLAEALIDQIPALTVTGGSQRPGEAATLSIRQSYTWTKDGGSSVPLVVIEGMIQLDPNTG